MRNRALYPKNWSTLVRELIWTSGAIKQREFAFDLSKLVQGLTPKLYYS